jgi:hypothetical protein
MEAVLIQDIKTLLPYMREVYKQFCNEIILFLIDYLLK